MEIMKNVVDNEKMDTDVKGMLIFLILMLIIGIPCLIVFDGIKGLISFLFFSIGMMYYAMKIEKKKKKYNIKTFKEIIAFSEGNGTLEELQKNRSTKNYLKEKILIVTSFLGVVTILGTVVKFITEFLMTFF
ncbi:hypothetical protein [Vagococcus bubulae]|uniref:hypothetical protein n=1 Tax=Vagococcus bubulae TaxID=1977868 RepID=UPI001FB1F104|nr:hypothetical protein [Vagococcus bubulae]